MIDTANDFRYKDTKKTLSLGQVYRDHKMTSDSRLLLGTIARNLTRTELLAAVYMCRGRVPADQLEEVMSAFDLVELLERQKVIDVESNNWSPLVDILQSKVVRRKDLAKLVSSFSE